MDSKDLFFLIAGTAVLFVLAVIAGMNLPIPFSADYVVFLLRQVTYDVLNAAISGVVNLPRWVLGIAFVLLVMIGAGYSDASDSPIVNALSSDSSSVTSNPNYAKEGARVVALIFTSAINGVKAIGHVVSIVVSEIVDRIDDSSIVSIDFAVAQISGVSVTVAGFVGKLIGNDSDED